MSAHTGRFLKFAVLGVVSIALVGGIAVYLLMGYLYPMREFNSAQWKAAAGTPASARNPRAAMVKSVMEKVALVGVPETEIIEKLGEPEKRGVAIFMYQVGTSGMTAGPAELDLVFDFTRRVSRVIYRDEFGPSKKENLPARTE